MQAWAELPDGGRQWLLLIEGWDFNWQDDYRYAEPLALPRGARLVMRYRYDNSAANVANPHSPPRRVVYGTRSSDEMANLLLEVVPATAEGRAALERASIAARLARDPGSWRAHQDLALFLAEQDAEAALSHSREAVRLRPDEPSLRFHLGTLLATAGRRDEGLAQLLEAVRLAPAYAEAQNHLGITYHELGRLDDAVRHYRLALAARAELPEARYNLGVALHELAKAAQQEGRFAAAAELYAEVLTARPDDVGARYNLAVALAMSDRPDAALPHFRRAVGERPELLKPLAEMAWTLATHPSPEVREPRRALPLAELAAELSGRRDPAVLDVLAAASAATGDLGRAIAVAEEALALTSADRQTELAAQIRRHLERYRELRPP